MTQRFRWTHRLADGREVTVSRVAGAHEDAEPRVRRYDARVPADVAAVGVGARVERDGDRLRVDVADGTSRARVRFRTDAGYSAVSLLDPARGAALTSALRGEGSGARTLVNAFGSGVAAVHACAPALDVDGVVSLVDALASARADASDDLHARRYALCRAAARGTNGLSVGAPAAFESLADGLDAVPDIGDVDALDALGDLAAVHGVDAVTALGYDLRRLAARADGRFRAYWLAALARDRGVDAARDVARTGERGDYERLESRASNAPYAERGSAWRALLAPAAARSRDEFAYALANACYWTGEVGRTDARADELCYDGALAAGSHVEWIRVHARYERARAVGHRHRSAANHALAVEAFVRAEAIAANASYSDVSPWDPRYSRAVVASNARAAGGEHEAAVEILEGALDDIAAYDLPDRRADEISHHLRGQRHERLAALARRDPDGAVETHLETAREHYEAVDFERSVERVTSKMASADGDGTAAGARGPAPRPPSTDRGPSIDDIPDLHDHLTEDDPGAVGSVDPGVLPDEDPFR
ncbi:MAG: hypothetical protein ABEJ80_05350 [Halarchaeum sp.]